MRKKIVILGGGISGLSTAYYLEKQGDNNDIYLVEASERLGGKVQTIYEDGFLVEAGPDSFVTTKAGIMELINDLDMASEIIAPNTTKFYILKNGRLQDIPSGFRDMKPTKIGPFLKSGLFSFPGKLRIMMEPFIKKAQPAVDESLESFMTRRFGKEMLSTYAEPLFTGIFSTPADQLSMDAAFPMFRQLEAKYGSVTKGLMAAKKPGGNSRSPFMGLKKGIQSLTDALIRNIKKTNVLLNTWAERVEYDQNSGKFRLSLTAKQSIEADILVCSLPAKATASLISPFLPDSAALLDEYTTSSSLIVTLAYEKKDIRQALDSTGFIVPRTEKGALSASTWSSVKWNDRSPEDYALIRCFMKEPEEMRRRSEKEIVSTAHNELSPLMGISAAPEKSWVHSWENNLPQYKVGHAEKVAKLRKSTEKIPNLILTGAYLDGVGLPDCIRRGKEAAEKAK